MSEYNEADSLRSLIRLLQQVEGTRVTLIGDVMLDRYHHGYSNNLNSTAPVPVLRVTNSEESPGAGTSPGVYFPWALMSISIVPLGTTMRGI